MAWSTYTQFYRYRVRLGDLDLNATVKDGATPKEVGINQTIIHPKYSIQKIVNDIALVRLQEPVKFTGES